MIDLSQQLALLRKAGIVEAERSGSRTPISSAPSHDACRTMRPRRSSDPRTVGEQPDYRFTLANERTFLAWIRTALALAAGGLGAISIIENFYGKELLGLTLLGLSLLTSSTAYRRWAANERAIRLREPLPSSQLPKLLAAGTALLAVGVAVLFALGAQ